MGEMAPEVVGALGAAGWVPGRRVDVEPWRRMFAGSGLDMHPAAEAFLAESGGLRVDVSGPGITVASTPFDLDPAPCQGEEGRFLGWRERTGRRLHPLGELDHGRFFLGIDERTEIYLVETWVAAFGPVDRALEALVLGIRPTEVG